MAGILPAAPAASDMQVVPYRGARRRREQSSHAFPKPPAPPRPTAADPSGDYAFALFDKAEARGHAPAGGAERLKAKALQLTGGPDSPKPASDRNVYGMLVASGRADVFLTYCTNAALARRDEPQLQVLDVPADINVSARYGLAVLKPATEAARRFVAYLLGPPGQAALERQGFAAPE